MVKKFKLIKKYPGSPKLGTEIFNWDYKNPDDRWSYNGNNGNLLIIPRKDVIDNPKFWEEVVEKEYEILSFYAKNISGKGDYYVDPDYIWYETHKGNGKWSRKGHITIPFATDEILDNKNYVFIQLKDYLTVKYLLLVTMLNIII